MAGRGRGMTLPAWMTEQTSSSSHTSPPASSSYGGGGYGGYAPSNGNDGRYDNSAYDPYGGGVGNINPPYGTAAPGYGGVDDRHQRSSRNRSRSLLSSYSVLLFRFPLDPVIEMIEVIVNAHLIGEAPKENGHVQKKREKNVHHPQTTERNGYHDEKENLLILMFVQLMDKFFHQLSDLVQILIPV